MKYLKKQSFFQFVTSLLILVCLLFHLPLVTLADRSTDLNLTAKNAIAIDAASGKVFFAKDSTTPVPIASMTKLITFYLILEAEAKGQISWDDKIKIDEHLFQISDNYELSNIPLIKGHSYSVLDLYNASVTRSANAAVTALAEHIAGSEKEFVDLMRQKVQSWGITDAYLISASGLNNEDVPERIYPGSQLDEENLMSVKDLALVAQHLLHDFPEVLATTKEPMILFAPGTDEELEMENTNLMLPTLPEFKAGVDGLKTGTTLLAGRNFAGTIVQDDLRLITIVAGIPLEGDDVRFEETAKLMDYVYQNWSLTTLYQAGDTLPALKNLPLIDGKELTVPVQLQSELTFWIEKSMDKTHLVPEINWTEKDFSGPDELVAPLKNKETLATLSVTLPQDSLGYLSGKQQVAEVKIETAAAAPRANILVLLGRQVKDFFVNLFH